MDDKDVGQDFWISANYVTDPSEHNPKNMYGFVKILIPTICPVCSKKVETTKYNLNESTQSTMVSPCSHFGYYDSIYKLRIKKVNKYDSCTKCGFEYPYGGSEVCKSCELWKVVGG